MLNPENDLQDLEGGLLGSSTPSQRRSWILVIATVAVVAAVVATAATLVNPRTSSSSSSPSSEQFFLNDKDNDNDDRSTFRISVNWTEHDPIRGGYRGNFHKGNYSRHDREGISGVNCTGRLQIHPTLSALGLKQRRVKTSSAPTTSTQKTTAKPTSPAATTLAKRTTTSTTTKPTTSSTKPTTSTTKPTTTTTKKQTTPATTTSTKPTPTTAKSTTPAATTRITTTAPLTTVNPNAIAWHGGPVMRSTVTVYIIWYGTWSTAEKNHINTFVSGLSGSPYWKINALYSDGTGAAASTITLGASSTDAYSLGKTLTEGQIGTLVSSSISSGKLPTDSNGIYVVLTASDVSMGSFCTSYCGWHTYSTVSSSNIKYSFVGNPTQCMSSCSYQSVGPNGASLAAADGLVSVLAHELTETISDPLLNAWYDAAGEENADKCSWSYGTLSTASNGAAYNIVLNGVQYLTQQNWVPVKNAGYCAMAAP